MRLFSGCLEERIGCLKRGRLAAAAAMLDEKNHALAEKGR